MSDTLRMAIGYAGHARIELDAAAAHAERGDLAGAKYRGARAVAELGFALRSSLSDLAASPSAQPIARREDQGQ